MARCVDIRTTFQAMLEASSVFSDALPSNVSAAERIRWEATWDERIGEDCDLPRPYALLCLDAFGAGRTTEGDSDLPISDASILLYLERQASDFETEASDNDAFKAWETWWGDLQDQLHPWTDGTIDFLRFRNTQLTVASMRTPYLNRGADDDFFSVGIHFIIGEGGS